ncbi:Protein F37C4.5 [Leucoagaricus sp. SymC.cos]|nr:Protein F37C4.5 [Leucoagaricus sp. SymC.cos]
MNTIRILASDYPVTSVTVLKSSKAEVSRNFEISLEDGRNKVIVTKLPTTIDEQSVRISLLNLDGTPSENTHLSDTVCSVVDNPVDDPTRNTLRSLEIKKSGLQSERKMLDTQAEVMVTYARSLTGQSAGIKDVDAFLSAFTERGKKNIEASMKIEEQIAEVNKQIQEEKRKKAQVKGSVNTEIGLVIAAEGEARIRLHLTYVVNNTKWTPTYEFYALTGEDGKPLKKVSFHYHASVKQATGEDWTDTLLTLSTVATDAIMKEIPTLQPVTIHPPQPASARVPGSPRSIRQGRSRTPVFDRRRRSRSRSRSPSRTPIIVQPMPSQPTIVNAYVPSTSTSFRVAPDFQASQEALPDDGIVAISDDEDFNEFRNVDGGKVDVPTTLVTQTPMTLTYAVRGRADIPSDGKDHTVTIAILTFEADIEYISVPKVDPRVFLQCKVQNDSEYRLLPGPVSVILDNNYVSRSRLSDVNRNDTFTFTLGDDPSIIISYERISTVTKEGTHTFAEPIDITTYTTTISVHNTHAFPIENLAIRDAIPISISDKRIKVLLRKPQELVGAQEGAFVEVDDGDDSSGDKPLVKWEKQEDGLYEYRWTVGAEDTAKFETVFDVKAPADLKYTVSNFDTQRKVVTT